MNQLDIKTLMEQALSVEYGLCISLPDQYFAHHYRRKFYAVRESLRKSGNKAYDNLSFILKNDADLWLIKREIVNQPPNILFETSRALKTDELPNRILSRGKSRAGICIS